MKKIFNLLVIVPFILLGRNSIFIQSEKSIKVVGLNELINIYPDMLKGSLPNKIVVDVNK